MALPLEWKWQTGDVKKLLNHILNNAKLRNQIQQLLSNSGQNHIRHSTMYFKFLQFSITEKAPVNALGCAMATLHDDVISTNESLCRVWHGVKVWIALFVRFKSPNLFDEPYNSLMPTTLVQLIPFCFTTSQISTQTCQNLTILVSSVSPSDFLRQTEILSADVRTCGLGNLLS